MFDPKQVKTIAVILFSVAAMASVLLFINRSEFFRVSAIFNRATRGLTDEGSAPNVTIAAPSSNANLKGTVDIVARISGVSRDQVDAVTFYVDGVKIGQVGPGALSVSNLSPNNYARSATYQPSLFSASLLDIFRSLFPLPFPSNEERAVQGGGNVGLTEPLSDLNCSFQPTGSIFVGDPVTFTASGGDAAQSYAWEARDAAGNLDGDPSSGSGTTFTSSFQKSGVKTATVTNAGASANCSVSILNVFKKTTTIHTNETPPEAVPPPACAANNSKPSTGDEVKFTAEGGDGSYRWQAPGGSPASGEGKTFTTVFAAAGTQPVSVESSGMTGQCDVAVQAKALFHIPAGLDNTEQTQILSLPETPAGLEARFSWNTRTVANGGHTLAATLAYTSGGRAAAEDSPPVKVAVVNDTSGGGGTFIFSAFITAPPNDSTVDPTRPIPVEVTTFSNGFVAIIQQTIADLNQTGIQDAIDLASRLETLLNGKLPVSLMAGTPNPSKFPGFGVEECGRSEALYLAALLPFYRTVMPCDLSFLNGATSANITAHIDKSGIVGDIDSILNDPRLDKIKQYIPQSVIDALKYFRTALSINSPPVFLILDWNPSRDIRIIEPPDNATLQGSSPITLEARAAEKGNIPDLRLDFVSGAAENYLSYFVNSNYTGSNGVFHATKNFDVYKLLRSLNIPQAVGTLVLKDPVHETIIDSKNVVLKGNGSVRIVAPQNLETVSGVYTVVVEAALPAPPAQSVGHLFVGLIDSKGQSVMSDSLSAGDFSSQGESIYRASWPMPTAAVPNGFYSLKVSLHSQDGTVAAEDNENIKVFNSDTPKIRIISVDGAPSQGIVVTNPADIRMRIVGARQEDINSVTAEARCAGESFGIGIGLVTNPSDCDGHTETLSAYPANPLGVLDPTTFDASVQWSTLNAPNGKYNLIPKLRTVSGIEVDGDPFLVLVEVHKKIPSVSLVNIVKDDILSSNTPIDVQAVFSADDYPEGNIGHIELRLGNTFIGQVEAGDMHCVPGKLETTCSGTLSNWSTDAKDGQRLLLKPTLVLNSGQSIDGPAIEVIISNPQSYSRILRLLCSRQSCDWQFPSSCAGFLENCTGDLTNFNPACPQISCLQGNCFMYQNGNTAGSFNLGTDCFNFYSDSPISCTPSGGNCGPTGPPIRS